MKALKGIGGFVDSGVEGLEQKHTKLVIWLYDLKGENPV